MGEKRQREQRQQQMLESSERCVYCASLGPFTLEHMPPIGMFRDRDRPKGWEFACCNRCNNGTAGVDAVAQMFAVIEPFADNPWKEKKFVQVLNSVRQLAPEVAFELTRQSSFQNVMINSNGLLRPSIEIRADGVVTRKHLDLFSEKVAMAAFAKLCGREIRMDGLLFTQWFLNKGMPLEIYHACLSIMPSFAQLAQGSKVSHGQFSLNFNTDGKGLLAAVVMFQSSLSMIIFATDDTQYLEPLRHGLSRLVGPHRPSAQLTVPGLLGLDQVSPRPPGVR